MGSIVKFTALSGGDDENPPCYLLEIDDFCILLDCGLSYDLNYSLLDPLKKYANKIDAVLLSNSDILHIGGLPYAVGKLGLTGTIYGTTPVLKMGTMFLYDLYENKMAQEEFEQFDLDDVDACFSEDRFKELSFSQHYLLQGKGKGISITPYLAGHMVGSSVWKITKGTYSIIYAAEFNHRNEGHLDSLQLTSDILKPSLLITDSNGVDRTLSYKKIATRDQALLEKIHNNLRSGGNVLLPVDTAGRVLELLLCIENYWVKNRLGLYTVGFLGRFSFNVCQFAKSQLEFMSSSASVRFEQKIDNPFTFRQIKIYSTIEDIPDTNTPKVILTSSQDLETGYSRDLFIKWCSDPKNLILFTNYIPDGSLASKVLNIKSNSSNNSGSSSSSKVIEIEQGLRVPLQGEELIEYEAKIAKEKEEKLLEQLKKEQEEQEERERLEMEEKGMVMDDGSGDSEMMNGNGIGESLLQNGAIINDSLSNFKNPFESKFDLSRVQFRRNGMVAMFPYYEKHVKWGEYGEEDEEFIEKNQAKKVEEVTMEEEEENEEEIPKKIVITNHRCEVNCKVDTIDYEGISDGRSIKTIIQQIAPTNLVLIRGRKDQSTNIENYVKENMRTKNIFSPSVNQELDLTSGTNVYELVLRDNLVHTLKPSKILDCEVSYIQGKVEINSENGSSYLDIIPSEQNNGHDESFIGDVKLADLKQLLVKAGLKKVQFDQGIINCNDLVYIWREDVGGNSIINFDGIISDEYYLVKELLYKQFQIV